MAIEKLTEFAKTGQKNTDDLNLEIGFVVKRKPARQWFNWLFNTLTTKINEIIDADFMQKSDIVDNLTTDDATKPVSARQAKILNEKMLDGLFENESPIDRSSQRPVNVTYTNPSSKKYILVVFQCFYGGPLEDQAVFLINDSPMFYLRNESSGKIITLLIPPQAKYRLNSPIADDVYISSWSEM